jgi:hypothetical protein
VRNKKNTNHVIPPCASPEKENAINDNETIYPIEPYNINVLLPRRSIRYQPTNVKTKLTTPIPTLERNALLFSNPAILNTLGAKYIMALIPDKLVKESNKKCKQYIPIKFS